MGPKKTVTQSVKGANPHASYIHRHHGSQTGQHFFGRFVGEGDRHQTARTGLAGLQQPCNAGGQYAGFARPSACEDECVLGRQSDSCQLLIIQTLQQRTLQSVRNNGGKRVR